MVIKVDSDINEVQWNQLTQMSPYATFFQTKECYDFYASLSFIEAFVYGVSENNELKGLISGYITSNGRIIKRFFSRRAIVHGGPLLADDISMEALELLLEEVRKKLSHRAIYVEFRNNLDYGKYKKIFEKVGFTYQPYLNYLIDTKDINIVNEKISNSKHRQIRKAKNSGVNVIQTTDLNDIAEFYKQLSELYRNDIKKPLFPKEFFEKLATLLEAHFFLAKLNGKVIGGMACVSLKNNTLYEWYVFGNKKEYNHLYPSALVTYSVIDFAAKNGYKYFDFMGAGKPGERYGVRDFKEKFGGKLVKYGRFQCINKPILYFLGEGYINLLKHL